MLLCGIAYCNECLFEICDFKQNNIVISNRRMLSSDSYRVFRNMVLGSDDCRDVMLSEFDCILLYLAVHLLLPIAFMWIHCNFGIKI